VWLMDASDDHFGHRSISPRSGDNDNFLGITCCTTIMKNRKPCIRNGS
jgi:hypothetical protein